MFEKECYNVGIDQTEANDRCFNIGRHLFVVHLARHPNKINYFDQSIHMQNRQKKKIDHKPKIVRRKEIACYGHNRKINYL